MEGQTEATNLKRFVTDKDYRNFADHGRDLDATIAIFLLEIRQYLNGKWQEQYKIKEPLKSLDQFNKDYLLEYPSSGGYAVLDDAFTGPDCPVEMFSPSSLEVLSYFYHMEFHDFSLDKED